MKLVYYPNAILSVKTQEVTVFDENLHSLLDEMKSVMLAEKGIGLANPQIGGNSAIFVMSSNTPFKKNNEIYEFINPKILEKSKGYIQISEGCLSAPGVFLMIPRHEEIHVQYQDRYGNIKQAILMGIESICFQHELDHLNGVFFIDRASRNERRAALKILGIGK